jgi:PEP-CTERM motif
MLKQLRSALYQSSIVIAMFAGGAQATPLVLTYSITGNGPYNYFFELTLDNHNGSWVAGQNFEYFVFGDVATGESPLTNFKGDPASLPVGPFLEYDVASGGGGHNGPSFVSEANGWVPASVGESLVWSGQSSKYLDQGDLRFSNLHGTGEKANFELAHLKAVPEPGTLLLLLAGLAVLFGAVGRRNVSNRRARLTPCANNSAPA